MGRKPPYPLPLPPELFILYQSHLLGPGLLLPLQQLAYLLLRAHRPSVAANLAALLARLTCRFIQHYYNLSVLGYYRLLGRDIRQRLVPCEILCLVKCTVSQPLRNESRYSAYTDHS